MKRFKLKLKILIFLLPIFAILAILFLILYVKTQSELAKIKSQKDRGTDETQKIISEVGRIVLLPKDETPTVATVSDVEKLKSNQLFFAKAENGDKVLIYTNAKKAILFRPAINKIIEFAPINLGDKTSSTDSGNLSDKEVVRVAVYNGTQVAGLAGSTEKELEAKVASIEVVEKGNTKNDFNKSLVVDMSGRNKKTAEDIAKVLGGEVVEYLPEGEKKPETDILVIVGK